MIDIDKYCDGFGPPQEEVIYLQYPCAICAICGRDTVSRWGVPIDMETGLVTANDFEGDWGAKPACRDCWKKHDEGGLVGHDPYF